MTWNKILHLISGFNKVITSYKQNETKDQIQFNNLEQGTPSDSKSLGPLTIHKQDQA